jgi:hypothetical protein
MKKAMKIEGIERLPFTNICPEKAANGAVMGHSKRFGQPDHEG